MVKNPPAMQEPQEAWVQSLGQEDLLEEGMATLSSIAWRIPRTEEPGGLHSPWGRKESDTTKRLSAQHSTAGIASSELLLLNKNTKIL